MSVRWQERRLEDDLLKRELLLRLLGEHYATPGRSETATDDFSRRVRRLLLRHPLFAFRYYRFAIDLALGRFDGHDLDDLPDLEVRPPIAGRILDVARRRRPFLAGGFLRISSAHLVRLRRGSAAAGKLLYGHLLRTAQVCGSALAVIVANLQRNRRFLQARGRRLKQVSGSELAGLVARLSRQRLVLRGSLVRLERASGSGRAELGAEARRARRLLLSCGVRAGRLGRRAVAAAVTALRRERRILYARLVRLGRSSVAVRRGLVVRIQRLTQEQRRLRMHSYGLLPGAGRTCRSAAALLVAKVRQRSGAPVDRLRRTPEATLTAVVVQIRRQRAIPSLHLAGLVSQGGAVTSRVAVPRPRWEHRRSHAVAAVLAGVLVAGATGIAVARMHAFGSSGGNGATASGGAVSPLLFSTWHPPRAASTPTGAARHGGGAKRVDRPAKPQRHVARKRVRQTVLVADTVPTTAVPSTAPPTASTHDNGPAPLPAPAGDSAVRATPSPLKAP
jgi:hypothetical protein